MIESSERPSEVTAGRRPAEIGADVLAARNALNDLLTEAAKAGIKVQVRLVPAWNCGAARADIAWHDLVEALPELPPSFQTNPSASVRK